MAEVRAQIKTTTTSDGVEILAVQQACAPHPHPSQNGKIVPFNYVEELLLADGTTRFRCAYPVESGRLCGKDTFTEVKSVPAHQSSHSERGPQYPEETLRTLVLTVRACHRMGYRDYQERAAAELNKNKVPTLSGEPWTAQQVSQLFSRYKDVFRTHVRQARLQRMAEAETPTQENPVTVITPAARVKPAASAASAATSESERRTLSALDKRAAELTRDTAELYDRVKKHSEDLADFMTDVVSALRTLAARPDADPEVVAKAQKWDEMQKLLGRD